MKIIGPRGALCLLCRNMKHTNSICLSLSLLLASVALAQKTGLKIDEIPSNQDTTITIQKGLPSTVKECEKNAFEIVSGTAEITGEEEFDEKKALQTWKDSCAEWKVEIKELNKSGQVLVMDCGSRVKAKEKGRSQYKSFATYKLKVRVKD